MDGVCGCEDVVERVCKDVAVYGIRKSVSGIEDIESIESAI